MRSKSSKLTELKGVGPKLAEQLQKLHIHTLADLFFHLPFRYEDRSRITPIGALQPMSPAVFQGEVRGANILFGKRRSLLVKLQDHSGTVSLRFYHFNAAQKNQMSVGTTLRCYGEPRRGASGLEIYHPEYSVVRDDDPPELEAKLTPVYPATDGISQQRLRLLHQPTTELLTHPATDSPDPLPAN